jgi:hypothetical protein
MSEAGIQPREYDAEVVTNQYLLTGYLSPLGPLLTYLNQADRGLITMRAVSATALEAASTVGAFQAGELIVVKDDIIAIRLVHPVTQTTVQLLPKRERLLVFTSRLVVQGDFHCGPDTRVHDLFESTPGRWAPASDAQIYPLLPFRATIFSEANLLLVNKRHIRMFHPVGP